MFGKCSGGGIYDLYQPLIDQATRLRALLQALDSNIRDENGGLVISLLVFGIMTENAREQLDETLSKDSYKDLLEMSLTELAVYTEGYAQPGSQKDEFFKRLVTARSTDANVNALNEASRAYRDSSEEIVRTLEQSTATFRNATSDISKELKHSLEVLTAVTHGVAEATQASSIQIGAAVRDVSNVAGRLIGTAQSSTTEVCNAMSMAVTALGESAQDLSDRSEATANKMVRLTNRYVWLTAFLAFTSLLTSLAALVGLYLTYRGHS